MWLHMRTERVRRVHKSATRSLEIPSSQMRQTLEYMQVPACTTKYCPVGILLAVAPKKPHFHLALEQFAPTARPALLRFWPHHAGGLFSPLSFPSSSLHLCRFSHRRRSPTARLSLSCKRLFASSLLTPTLFEPRIYNLYSLLNTFLFFQSTCQTLDHWPPWPLLRLSSLLRLARSTLIPIPIWSCTG